MSRVAFIPQVTLALYEWKTVYMVAFKSFSNQMSLKYNVSASNAIKTQPGGSDQKPDNGLG